MTTSPDHRRPLAGLRVTTLLVSGLIFGATFLVAPMALADCVPTDPSCVRSAVEDAVGAASDAAHGAPDTVAGAVDQASGRVDGVVDTVKHTLGGKDPDPGPGGGGSNGSGGSGGPGSNGGTRGSEGGRPVRRVIGVRPELGLVPTPGASSGGEKGLIPHMGLFDRLGGQAVQLAKGVAFPAILGAMVILFVMVQNRIDRRDPKLARAPITADVLRFE